ncbi:hypothetical protein P154DRAFT_520537 [Amniculicola lignicola CBS 123094]|uniref:Inclusion body clearance protein IML2 n=1 Tax=Amniculicola lignicola CBS 123094 TaxID=1392246 RepID=A0A6A5WP19_9PLEO|nr:hypothetical protein P154DRAFT_520537 [Amniculicola lignicola CBS 123094]
MFKVGGWLGGGKHLRPGGSTRSLNALDELSEIEDAMAAVSYIMSDDVDAAEKHLSNSSSPFHQLGKGVVTFIRATLGFEQDIMREASETLSSAEDSAYEHQRRAQRTPHAYQSPIYPAGTEYAVCLAEAQLMSAIVGMLNESLTEAVRSFYKLRKAYLTLEGIMDAEKKFLNERSTSSLASSTSDVGSRPGSRLGSSRGLKDTGSIKSKLSAVGSSTSLNKNVNKPDAVDREKQKELGKEEKNKNKNDDDDDDFDFADSGEEKQGKETPVEYMGHLGAPSAPEPSTSVPEAIEDFEELTLEDTILPDSDISKYGTHPVDVFIISGANFCFGILLLLISLVPPAFATLLKIVGFKGDRERGIQMLWQATKFHNIHGAMAGLVLFGFYNGMIGFCDIIPQSGEGSHPKERCEKLLKEMRTRYPKSQLWLLEEARLFAGEKDLEKAIDFMKGCDESQLKQLEALQWFERSLNTMYLHDFAGTASAFQVCITLNNWSHGLYYYICGASHVQLYRTFKDTDPKQAEKERANAKDFFKKVAPNTGKKKFMARQLPFDVFVNRKISKWEGRAKEWECDMIDAVGVAPIEEMIYFWNGYKRMRNEHLDVSLANLAWSESPANPHWSKEGLDEKGILALLRAATLRNKGETEKAKTVLQEEIICNDKLEYKGGLKDNWTAPCARYEMAACVYREADTSSGGRPDGEKEMLEECKTWLEEVSRWEGFDLDARIGMKVTTGKNTLRRYGVEC